MNTSYATTMIKHHRNIVLLMILSPIVVMFLVMGIFYQTNRSGVDAQLAGKPPYDPVAIFNTPIPNNYPSDSRSNGVISKWTSVMSNNSGIFFAINGEVPGLYKSTNSDPLYSFSGGGTSGTFRAPTTIAPGGGSDHPLIILNTSTMQELRLWQANVNHSSRTISASNAGLFYYNNDGSIKNPNGSRSLSIPYQGGGAGNGLSYYAGMITRQDWELGVIRHNLRIAYNNCSFVGGSHRIPATKSDQPKGCSTTDSFGGMEMGMILQLDKSIDCNSRTSPTGKANDNKFVRMVCKAMQDYGVMIADGTGASANFYMEHESTANWGSILTKSSTGHLGNHFRNPSGTNGIPWNKFRVVAKPASYTSWGAGTPVNPSPGTPPSESTPLPLAKPVAPAGLKLTPGSGKLVATWNTSPSSERVDSYQVYLNGSYSYSTVTSPSFTINGTPGQTYTVRVSAHNATGYGPWSASVSGVIGSSVGAPTPDPVPPPAPPDPLPPITVPNANPDTPVGIPNELPVAEDGTIIADFTGDGLNEVVKDLNADGLIDPESEIIINGKENSELTDSTATPLTPKQYMQLLSGDLYLADPSDRTITLGLGPLPDAKLSKPLAYAFFTTTGFSVAGALTYILATKTVLFAGIRSRLGI